MFVIVHAPEGLYVVFFLQIDSGLYRLGKVFCINSTGCRPDGKPPRLPLERHALLPQREIDRLLCEYCGGDETARVVVAADFIRVWQASIVEDAEHEGGAALRNLLKSMGLAPKDKARQP